MGEGEREMRNQIRSHTELEVYRKAFDAAIVWLQFAVRCGYVERDTGARLYQTYDEVLSILVDMIHHAEQWILPGR